ncbi:hypothetical protein [Pleionea sp. CnH1-48]|uniref:hypothetical protein n=1 Tax=Pleionea sp. CnH1-48 TaxID=2954494 RepID=UPI0020984E44|nr:hypothetical protein [Pleionea sp. CnH1-48]MCO7226012.1 hypothetical protein [Pleionea sp. CnH1-48]
MYRVFLIILLFAPFSIKAESTLEGTLEVLIEDHFEAGKSQLKVNLIESGTQKTIPLIISEKTASQFLNGDSVLIKGDWNASDVAKKAAVIRLQVNDIEKVSVAKPKKEANAKALDERNALVVLVDFTDEQTGSYFNRDQIIKAMYSNVDSDKSANLATEHSSFFQARFNTDVDGDNNPDVFGPIQLGIAANKECKYSDWANAADNKLSESGTNLSQYRHRVYIFPPNVGCSWAGLAHVGCGNTCRAWIETRISSMAYVLAHELGHNLGSSHASTLKDDGSLNEYGDKTDYMGSGYRPMNAAHRDLLGWYDDHSDHMLTLNQSAELFVMSTETDLREESVQGYQVIKVPTLQNDDYYVSYRKDVGAFGMDDRFDNRFTLHRLEGRKSVFVKDLGQGESFNDADRGVTFEALQTGGDSAQIRIIHKDKEDCIAREPTVELTEGTLQTDHSGRILVTQVKVTNNDTSGCAERRFKAAVTLADGLSHEGLANDVFVAADGSVTESLEIRSADTLTIGDYAFNIELTDETSIVGKVIRTTGQYKIVADTTAPTVPAKPTAKATETDIEVTWEAVTDDDTLSYVIYRNDQVLKTVTDLTYKDSAVSNGETYTYAIAAKDASNNESAKSESIEVKAEKQEDSSGSMGIFLLALLGMRRLRQRRLK